MLRMPSDLERSLSRLLAPPVRSLCPSGVVRSPLPASLVVRRGVGRGVVCRAVMRCGEAYRSSFVSLCRSAGRASAGRRAACLRSSSRYSVRAADCLPLRGSFRLIGTGCEVVLPLLAWMRRAGECGDYVNYRLSVDCFGAGGYINTRALIGFSFRCFLARACCAGGFSVLLPPPNRSRHRPNKSVPPGHDGSDFFCQFPLLCLLRRCRLITSG